MTSGLRDYDDPYMINWTWTHEGLDYEPLDFLYALDKTFLCNPGDCLAYSSVGYIILGLALA